MVASGDNEMSREADRINREIFEEARRGHQGGLVAGAVQLHRQTLHLSAARDPRSGRDGDPPDAGAPARAHPGRDLPARHLAAPRWPTRPEPATAACSPWAARAYVKGNWDRFAEEAAEAGRALGPGEGRCLQLIVHAAATTAEAIRVGEPGLRRARPVPVPVRAVPQYRAGSPVRFRPDGLMMPAGPAPWPSARSRRWPTSSGNGGRRWTCSTWPCSSTCRG